MSNETQPSELQAAYNAEHQLQDQTDLPKQELEPRPRGTRRLSDVHDNILAGDTVESGVERERVELDGGELAKSGRNKTLSAEHDDLLQLEKLREEERSQRAHSKGSLQDAYNNVSEESDEPGPVEKFLNGDSTTGEFLDEGELPEAIRNYDPQDIEAALTALGLSEEDLAEDESLAEVVRSKLEEMGATEQDDDSESQTDESDGDEATEGEKPEEAKPEEPLPSKYEELSPEQKQSVHEHVTGINERAQQANHPVMTEVFARSLADALQSPPETFPQVVKAAQVLQAGAQSLMETVVPQLVHSYLAQTFRQYMEMAAPGLGQSVLDRTCETLWKEVCDMEEFAPLKLPAFNSPEFDAAGQRIYSANPWLHTFFPQQGPDGKQLSPGESLKIRAITVARLLAGERLNPKEVMKQVTEAVKRDREDAARTNRKVSASRSLGAGRSTQSLFERTEQYSSLRDAWDSRHGSLPERSK